MWTNSRQHQPEGRGISRQHSLSWPRQSFPPLRLGLDSEQLDDTAGTSESLSRTEITPRQETEATTSCDWAIQSSHRKRFSFVCTFFFSGLVQVLRQVDSTGKSRVSRPHKWSPQEMVYRSRVQRVRQPAGLGSNMLQSVWRNRIRYASSCIFWSITPILASRQCNHLKIKQCQL